MTHNIEFPNLGLSFTVNTTAIQIGNFYIQWYGIIIAAGFLLALLYAYKMAYKMNINRDKLFDCIIVGLICGIVGARIYYVIFYTGNEYINDPLLIFNIKEGGLGIYGGIIGGLLGGAITAKIKKIKVPAMLDIASLGFLIGQCIGRWGNFINQEAFGTATDLPWGMKSDVTELEVVGNVHPCFLYESLLCLIGFILLHFFNKKFRHYDGQTFLLYLIWYGIGRFFIEGLRTDSLVTPYFDLRVSQVVAVATVAAAIVLLIVFWRRTSLTGCGNKKIMELNGIVLGTAEIPEKKSEDESAEKEEKDSDEDNSEVASEKPHIIHSTILDEDYDDNEDILDPANIHNEEEPEAESSDSDTSDDTDKDYDEEDNKDNQSRKDSNSVESANDAEISNEKQNETDNKSTEVNDTATDDSVNQDISDDKNS
jgi:phosphatidylglycerol:prolipoprotein diacylglycerol transferase